MNKDDVIRYLNNLLKNKKPNINHFPIIDKWNYKYIIKPNLFKIYVCLFNFLEQKLTEEKFYEEIIKNFVDIKKI